MSSLALYCNCSFLFFERTDLSNSIARQDNVFFGELKVILTFYVDRVLQGYRIFTVLQYCPVANEAFTAAIMFLSSFFQYSKRTFYKATLRLF